jgi:AraC-like DNA-binding protein
MTGLIEVEKLNGCLAAHPLFRCADDMEETCSQVGKVFRPHRMGVVGSKQRLNARMDHLRLGRLSFNRLNYASGVTIDSDPMGEFLMVLMPIAGVADIRCGSESVRCTPELPAVVGATQPLAMRWRDDCDQLIVRIERDAIESACSAYLGHELTRPLEFDLAMDLDSRSLACWQSVVSFLASNEAFVREATSFPLLAGQAEQLLLCALLTGQGHSYRDELLNPCPRIAPSYIRRAEDYLAAHCDQPLSMTELALNVGVSVRSLHAGFQRYRGITPMAALRNLRLDRVRRELRLAMELKRHTTVGEVAMAWGFSHLGHFTKAYQAKFQEAPSHTLKGLR